MNCCGKILKGEMFYYFVDVIFVNILFNVLVYYINILLIIIYICSCEVGIFLL